MLTVNNPIIPGFSPDPSICRVGNDYYLACSSFEYFPGVPIYHSQDLANWSLVGHALTRESQLPLDDCRASGGIYAPTLRHHAGMFYLVTTNVSHGGNFIVHTENPAGEWSEPVPVHAGGIDPSLFWDEDGTCYYTAQSNGGILQAKIDPLTGTLLSEPQVVWHGTGGQWPEGPHLFKRNGIYYLTIAEGGTEYMHMQTLARSSNPFGPFEPCPHNPVLTHRSRASKFHVAGHADLFQAANGDWFGVCLAVRPHAYPPVYHLGRETFLFPVKWQADGWPELGHDHMIPESVELPWNPVLSTSNDDLEWVTLRHPSKGRVEKITEGWKLHGLKEGLDSLKPVAWVGRRQRHFEVTFQAALALADVGPGDEAGISIRMNERHRYELAVTQNEIITRRTIGNLSVITSRTPTASPVELRVDATTESYECSYRPANGDWTQIDKPETRYIATEVAGGFTGVLFALYCASPTEETVATFTNVKYRPLTH